VSLVTSTLVRLADAAVAARGGADLYRFGLDARIPDAAFAAQSDGTVLVKGIELLKDGTFNGFEILAGDLGAMVERFESLRDAGIFVPPFRLDHSWSVLSVVGYFEALDTTTRVDDTDGRTHTFLTGDVRLTGSIDYTPDQLVKAIKRGALRSRSSELGYYVTNAGTELPLVFYGCAFVDIPAVEGLAPVTLSKRSPEPHTITNLTADPTEGTAPMDPEKLARLRELRAMTSLSAEESAERDALNDEATAAGMTEEDLDSSNPTAELVELTEVEGDETEEEEPEVEEDPEPEPDPVVEPEPVVEPGTAEPSAELAQLREQVARLRQESTDREVARFREAGAIVTANEEAAVALLSHDSEEVRRAAGTLLGSMTTRIDLGKRRGRQALSSDASSGSGDALIRLGMTGEEVGALWADLTTEERKLRQAELDAWTKDRNENGIRD
jgi:hypothetical protein